MCLVSSHGLLATVATAGGGGGGGQSCRPHGFISIDSVSICSVRNPHPRGMVLFCNFKSRKAHIDVG